MSSQKSGDAMEPNIELDSVESITQNLRERSQNDGVTTERIVAALARVGDIWESRLAPDSDWTPPDGSPFPWVQVRISLAGLVPGLKGAGTWLLSAIPSHWRYEVIKMPKGRCASLILSGNTPLMSWSPLCACLMAGHSVFVKMSRDETLWPRLFVESLAEVDEAVAARIHLDVWPGEGERTSELCRASDVVIAFGSDATIDALRGIKPERTPFFGFGHSISIGLAAYDWIIDETGVQFARDIFLYEQQGCLSPQTIFTAGSQYSPITIGRESLPYGLEQVANDWNIPPVTDAVTARIIREGRDLALFSGFKVIGPKDLRWTIAYTGVPGTLPKPIGHRFVYVVPLWEDELPPVILGRLGNFRGRISSIGVAGVSTDEWNAAFYESGVSRICAAGEMQSPPLEWRNGNVDLLTELLRVGQNVRQLVAERR